MRLTLAGSVGELVLGSRACSHERLHLRVELAARDELLFAALSRSPPSRVERSEVEHGDRCLDAGDLGGELLGPLGSGRLERQRAKALAHLVLEVAGALRPGSRPARA